MTLPVIASIGAGRMGRGIAHAFSYAGYEVWLVDIKARGGAELAKLEAEARAEVDASLASLSALGAFDDRERAGILARIRFAGREAAPAALARADVVFEGVPEVLDVKAASFGFACRHLREDAIVASTTSTFLVSTLADLVSHPRRFLNAHWLNPAYLIPLVELSAHAATDAHVIERLKSILERAGKVPVLCAAAPGYIVPRFQSLIMNEAARMIEQGLATAEDIDRAVRHGFGFRYANMGVVEFIDYGGVDILHYAGNYLADTLGERYRPPAVIAKLMAEGKKGLREGEGFYDWRKIDVAAYRTDALERMLGMLRYQGLHQPPGAALKAR